MVTWIRTVVPAKPIDDVKHIKNISLNSRHRDPLQGGAVIVDVPKTGRQGAENVALANSDEHVPVDLTTSYQKFLRVKFKVAC